MAPEWMIGRDMEHSVEVVAIGPALTMGLLQVESRRCLADSDDLIFLVDRANSDFNALIGFGLAAESYVVGSDR